MPLKLLIHSSLRNEQHDTQVHMDQWTSAHQEKKTAVKGKYKLQPLLKFPWEKQSRVE